MAALWAKLFEQSIDGKCLRMIKSMYKRIKSCVSVWGSDSELCPCLVGVRHGDNVSSVLFSLFSND